MTIKDYRAKRNHYLECIAECKRREAEALANGDLRAAARERCNAADNRQNIVRLSRRMEFGR